MSCPWQTTFHTCCFHSPYGTPLGEDLGSCAFFPVDLTSFSLADSILSFTKINHCCEYDYMLGPVSSARKSLNLRVALDIPVYCPFPFQVGFHFKHLPVLTLHFPSGKSLTTIISAITFILPPSMLNLKLITTALGYFYMKYIGTSNPTGSKINSLQLQNHLHNRSQHATKFTYLIFPIQVRNYHLPRL